MTIAAGFSNQILNMVQEGLIERTFHDPLFAALMYRQVAEFEQWEANTGQEILMTRKGLIEPTTTPLTGEPSPKTSVYEQWYARLDRYGDAIDTHMPTSAVSSINTFLSDIKTLGLQAGQSINRIARNSIFTAYLSGQTLTTASALSADTSIRVASLNGFLDVIVKGVQVRPTPVSSATPLLITISGITGTRGVIAVIPDDAGDPWGPGTLLLNQALGANIAARAPVLSGARPLVIRAGGGTSIDAIGSTDIVTLQDFINAAGRLRRANVQPMEDGMYHAHIPISANNQLFADPAFQSALRGQVENQRYKMGFIGAIAGISFYVNNESPDPLNTGTRTATGTNANYSYDVHAETTNESSVNIARALVVGRGALYERGLDESNYLTEAGVTGKVGEFNVVNGGLVIPTERIRFVLRAPINRLMDQVSSAWSISTCFPVPSDVAAGDAARYKRGVIVEFADDQ